MKLSDLVNIIPAMLGHGGNNMPVYECKKTKRLYIQFDYQGVTHKKRLPERTSKTEADRLEIKLKHDLIFDNKNLLAGPVTVIATPSWEDFVRNVYLEHVAANQTPASLEKAVVICRESMKFFKGRPIDQIKPADVEKFKARRMQTPTRHGRPRMAATIHREMSIISRVFSLAVRNDLCDYKPCSRIELPKFDNTQDLILEFEKAERFFASFRNSLQRDIATLVIFTGLRQNDVFGLDKTKHVNWHREEITLLQGKTKRKVVVPMNRIVKEILMRRLHDPGDLFFPSYRTGEKLKSIKNGIRFACIRAGIPKLGMRALRRSFGTWLHELGYDDSTVASLLGHSDLRSVPRYKRGTKIKRAAVLDLEKIQILPKSYHSQIQDDRLTA